MQWMYTRLHVSWGTQLSFCSSLACLEKARGTSGQCPRDLAWQVPHVMSTTPQARKEAVPGLRPGDVASLSALGEPLHLKFPCLRWATARSRVTGLLLLRQGTAVT